MKPIGAVKNWAQDWWENKAYHKESARAIEKRRVKKEIEDGIRGEEEIEVEE